MKKWKKSFLLAVSKAARRQFDGDGWPPPFINQRDLKSILNKCAFEVKFCTILNCMFKEEI